MGAKQPIQAQGLPSNSEVTQVRCWARDMPASQVDTVGFELLGFTWRGVCWLWTAVVIGIEGRVWLWLGAWSNG